MRLPTRPCLLVVALLGVACFRGGEREKEAPPGLPGGLCLAPQPPAAPDPFCEEGLCNLQRNYCYLPDDPCEGFFCGGSERGVCMPNSLQQPTCTCHPGFDNEQYDLYCCPQPSTGILDSRCNAAPTGDPDDSGGADDAGVSDGTDAE